MEAPRIALQSATGLHWKSGERAVAFALFLLVTGLTAALYRDFSHIRISWTEFPVYVTELSLLLIGGLLAIEALRIGKLRFHFLPSALFAGLYLLWGFICFYRGRHDGMLSLRESATNYYALFYLLVPSLVLNYRDLRRLWTAMLLGTVVAFAIVVARVATGGGTATSTGALRFHAPVALGAATMLFWLFAAPAARLRSRAAGMIAGCACLLVIIVATQHRSAAVAILVALSAWLIVLGRGRGVQAIGSTRSILAVFSIGLIALLFVPEIARLTVGRLQTIGTNLDEFNASWRLAYWGILLANISNSPLIGFGFGNNFPVFDFRGVTFGLDPNAPAGVHNSFLFVWYKEGLVGLGLLLAFCASVLWTVTRNLWGQKLVPGLWQASAAATAFVFVCVFALFNVVLEGPYMGMFFWILPAMAELAVAFAKRKEGGVATQS